MTIMQMKCDKLENGKFTMKTNILDKSKTLIAERSEYKIKQTTDLNVDLSRKMFNIK